MTERPPTGPRTVGKAPRGAPFLIYGAVAPLALLLVPLAFGAPEWLPAESAARTFLAYAVALLAFHAGLAAGQAVRAARERGRSLIPVGLAIAAVVTLLVPPVAAPLVLAALTAAQGAFDVWTADGIRMPAWYGRLRAGATIVTVMLLVAAFVLMPAG